LVSKS